MLALAFCSKILGGGGDLTKIVLLKNEWSLSGVDTQHSLTVKKIRTFCTSTT